ncbi:hypothetical protein MiAbB_03893 [Microcystis aeruginosa NIES-4285]|uniref:Uncharacterized protein n=1 Tax=Microcystis aeruginosa NIES-4285 TaxID=2497681 RepID=A0A402DII2_MICAE|nr:hypothetical protein MiAbB_03893 [Microcystis aeruginosa NIES-4285]
MLKSLISKGLTVPHRCENRYNKSNQQNIQKSDSSKNWRDDENIKNIRLFVTCYGSIGGHKLTKSFSGKRLN